MKKIFSISLAAMAGLVLASCNGDYDNWVSPQGYDQEDPAAAYGVSASTSSSASNITMPVSDDQVSLVTFSSSNSDVASYYVRSLTINDNAVSTTLEGNNVSISADALENMLYEANNSRACKTYDLTVVTEYGAVLNNGDAVAGKATTAAKFTTRTTPAIDSKGYYLLGSFEENGDGWDLTAPVWMTEEGDGVYSVIVNTTSEEDNWFKFYEGSYYSDSDWDTVNQGQMGCQENGSAALQDFIVWTGDKYAVQTPVIRGKGMFKVTIDVKNFTYKVVRQEYKLYIVGGPNDWAASAASKELKFNQADIEVPYYTITFPAAAEGDTWFAIGDDAACDAITNDGNWKLLFGTTSGNGNSGASGTFTRRTNLTDDGAFCVPAGSGLYIQVTLDLNDYSYTVSTLDFGEYYYEIGAESEWGVSHPLYGPNGDGKYQGYYYLNGEFKFKPNADNWEDDLEYVAGDEMSGTLQSTGGPNCPDPGAGFYRIDLDAAVPSYSLTRIDVVSIIGTANGNWDTDTDLAYNKEEGCWEVTTELNAGEMKFRGNHNWDGDVDLGGSFDNLVHGGANIAVEAGTYTIKLYISIAGQHYAEVTKH